MAVITATNPRLFDFVTQWEARIPWMYLDSKGFPTVGIGHLIGKISTATREQMKQDALDIHRRVSFFSGGSLATETQVIQRLYGLQSVPEAHRRNYRAEYWRDQPPGTPQVELTEAGMRGLKHHDLGLRITGLRHNWPGAAMASLPEAVQIVLVDIAYNAGVGSLRRGNMQEFRSAVNARDFARAAHVVGRGDFPIRSRPQRNRKRAEMLRRA